MSKRYQSLEDKSVRSVFAAFSVKFNLEFSYSEKVLYNEFQKLSSWEKKDIGDHERNFQNSS